MPVVKIKPPEPLPLRDLSEQKFGIWKNQLKAWLASDDTLAVFLPTGTYPQWESEEVNPRRIQQLIQPGPDPDLPANPHQAHRDQLLDKRCRQLEIFLRENFQLLWHQVKVLIQERREKLRTLVRRSRKLSLKNVLFKE